MNRSTSSAGSLEDENMSLGSSKVIEPDSTLDAKGLCCPIPILKTSKAIKGIQVGQVLEVQATELGSKRDIPAWCKMTGHEILGVTEEEGPPKVYKFYIRRGK